MIHLRSPQSHALLLLLLVSCSSGSPQNNTGTGGGAGTGTGGAATGGSAGGRGGSGGGAGSTGGTAGSIAGAGGSVGGTGGSGGSAGSGGSGPTCPTGRTLCGTECVDTTANPLHCNGCGRMCGANQVCVSSACQTASDCRSTPCPGLSYCDLATGLCNPGCALDTQCSSNETCDIVTHACTCKSGFNRCGGTCVANSSGMLGCGAICAVCPTTNATAFACSGTQCVATACASGAHLCAGQCSSNTSPASCGTTSCTPCPTPANGTATCNGSSCGIACNTGYLACSGACAACPTANATATACSGAACVATGCNTGYLLCSGACAACPTNASLTACSGAACIATTCSGAYHACSGMCASNSSVMSCGSSSCTPCPSSPNGTTSCNGLTCSLVCSSGYRNCSNTCALCPAGGSSYTCSGTQCVAISCSGSGTHLCSGMCVSNTSVQSCGTSCTPCPAAPTNGTVSCNGTACLTACNTGYVACTSGCCLPCQSSPDVCTGGTWCQTTQVCQAVQKLQPDAANATAGDTFGNAVALSGSLALVGSGSDDNLVGSAYLFERQATGLWTMVGSKLKPDLPTDGGTVLFGNSVALEGQRVVVGAPRDGAAGAVYLFEGTAGMWGPGAQTKLMGEGTNTDDQFGRAVALSGDRVIVGAPNVSVGARIGAGAVYIFERQTDGSWPAAGIKLLPTNPSNASVNGFGLQVAISGERAVVAAAGASGESTYVFARQANGSWAQEKVLYDTSSRFGCTGIAVNGTRAISACYGLGQVNLYERRTDGTWNTTAIFLEPMPRRNANFGYAIALDGDHALIGAGGTPALGAVFLFNRMANGQWDTGTELHTASGDEVGMRQLGTSVALSWPYALGGAPTDVAAAPSAGVASGTAYVFNAQAVAP